MKTLFTFFLNCISNLFFLIIKKDKLFILLEILIINIQQKTKNFITYSKRPFNSNSIGTASFTICSQFQLAIVIQGPIIHTNSLTLETLKIYRKHLPNAIIILSTWENEEFSLEYYDKNLGIYIIKNRFPDYSGVSNINYQIISSKNGILKAKELGADYVIKTRSDQRFYSRSVDQYLYNILELFPIKLKDSLQNRRIVGLSLNTFKYRMYGLSDMFLFGHISDLILFWDLPLDVRKFNVEETNISNFSLRTYAEWRVCEVYLVTEFLKKIGYKVQWTLEDSWKIFSNHFCIIDRDSIDLFWGKYGPLEDRWVNYNNKINNFEELDFKEWLQLYTNIENIEFPENVLDKKL